MINSEEILSHKKKQPLQFVDASPFPHLVIDNFLTTQGFTRAVESLRSMPFETFKTYVHPNASVCSTIGTKELDKEILKLIKELQGPNFIQTLTELTGIDGLQADPLLAQGGLLSYPKGSFVNLHSDNLTHPFDNKLHTKLTLLIYLNENWPKSYGGDLALYDMKVKKLKYISPNKNRCVLMKVGQDCIHGLPDPLSCPNNERRNALILWYYQRSSESIFNPTTYHSGPNDSFKKRFQVLLGNFILKAYYLQRKFFGDWDPYITKIMKILFGRKK